VSDLHQIDAHHHILPTEYVSALAGIGITGGGGIPFPAWSAEAALALMDDNGIQAAVTSISAPGVHFGDASFAQDLARRCNEMSARLAGDHPTRFGSFATLPLPDVKGTLLELVGPSQIVFGSDYPFAPAPVTEASVRGLASFGGFDVPQRAAIEQDNALALLPGLRARLERA